MSLNATLLRDSFALVTEKEPELTKRFYETLFERHPQVKPLFGGKSTAKQQRMLAEAFVAVLNKLDDTSWLTDTLKNLGAKHVRYQVTDEMYPWVGEALLATLADIAGDAWNDELEQAWSDAYAAISGLMQQGAEEARAKTAATAEPVHARPPIVAAAQSKPAEPTTDYNPRWEAYRQLFNWQPST